MRIPPTKIVNCFGTDSSVFPIFNALLASIQPHM